MTDSAPPEDASPPAPAATPAASRWAKLWGQLKRFRGPIAAIAAFGAVLSGFLGYWSAYQTVQTVVVPKSAPAAVSADAGPLSIVVLPFQNLTGDPNQAYVDLAAFERVTHLIQSKLERQNKVGGAICYLIGGVTLGFTVIAILLGKDMWPLAVWTGAYGVAMVVAGVWQRRITSS